MSNIIKENNIVGNVEKLTEYKKEIKSSTSSIGLYCGGFICGIWMSQQPQVKTLGAGIIIKIALTVIPALLLLEKLIPTWLRYMNTTYESIDNTQKNTEQSVLFKFDKNANLSFKEYLKNFQVEHPILTLSIMGLIVNQVYFIDSYNNMVNFFKQIPLLNNFYMSWFSLIPLIILLIVGDYVYYIKNNILRRTFKVFIFVNFPVLFSGIILGLFSISLYPIISIIKNPQFISYFGIWIADIKNFYFTLGISVVIIYMFGNIIIKDINKEIDKCVRL